MTKAPISIPLLSFGLLCSTFWKGFPFGRRTVFPEAPLLPAQSPGLEDHLLEGHGLPSRHPPFQNFKLEGDRYPNSECQSTRLQVLSYPQSKPRVMYIAATGPLISSPSFSTCSNSPATKPTFNVHHPFQEDPEDHRPSTTPLLLLHQHVPLHLHRRYPLRRCTQGLHLRPPLHCCHHCSGRPLPMPHPMVQG
ncbi:hypothetical protein BKA70DRAFT_1268299 [Coprinopsis sp. MPI-PUGE-AT-0042]|nr:hypothetical protein BKA70DRAFT_1268299 [Coprinopsis sp. MPI-PUGE-AT-0042]